MPYLDLTRMSAEEEQIIKEIEMPDVTGITLKAAKVILKELDLEYEIDTDELDAVITNQVPKKGIKINTGTKVILYSNL